MNRRIFQVIVGAGSGDAITSMALHLQPLLAELGETAVFAHHVEPAVADRVLPLSQLPDEHRGDVLVYHASYGIPEITRTLLRRRRLIVVYHNITPSEFFIDHNPQMASELQWGRHELELLRPRVDLAVAVSAYNARDLESMGYEDVRVLPAGLHPGRLLTVSADVGVAGQLLRRFPNGYILSVSQVLPHKRHDLLLQAMSLARSALDSPLGLAVVGPMRMVHYAAALNELARRLRLDNVWFMGSLSERALAASFRLSRVFVSTSAHEGLALPPLEAMSFGVPVVAKEAGAMRDTVGDAALLLPTTAGPTLLAEAIVETSVNAGLRRHLTRRGFERVRDVEAMDPSGELIRILQERL